MTAFPVKQAGGHNTHWPQKALGKGNHKGSDVVARKVQHGKGLVGSGLFPVQEKTDQNVKQSAANGQQNQAQQGHIDLFSGEVRNDRGRQSDPDGDPG